MAEYKEVTRAIIENEERKVLLGKRAGGSGEGLYALIGGKPDPGEFPEQTIRREVWEELEIDIEPIFYMEMIDSTSDPNQPRRTVYFLAKLNGNPNPNPDEIVDIVYVSVDSLDDLQIAFDHRERLLEYFAQR